MNFAMVLVFAIVAMQASEGRTASGEDTPLSLITTLKIALEQISLLITKISSQLPDLISHVKDTLQDIVSQIPQLLASLQKEVQEVLDEIMKCMKEYTFNPSGLYKCLSEQVQPLIPVLQELQDEVVNVYVLVMEGGENMVHEIVEGVGGEEKQVDAKYTVV